MKNLPDEEQIKARLRELTEQTRRVREELERMIRRGPERVTAFGDDRLAVSDDRPPPTRSRKKR